MADVVTRFPPSPTGNLHVGTARTAIFNYIFAKNQNGRLLMRLEDTDKERSTEESVQNILDGLKWLDIQFEGEPVRQSTRLKVYQDLVQQLLSQGKAYEDKDPEKGTAIRIKSNNKVYTYNDLILGESQKEAYDAVIMKSDGYPTYQLAVCVDDYQMGVTHVIRGNDLFASMPVQMAVYEAFGWAPPQFAHLPMILGPDKQKLSKRHGATSISEYRDLGYLMEATFNFLTLLGWAPGNDQEIISRQETIEKFDITRCKKTGAVFDMQKFQWMNKEYIKNMPVAELSKRLTPKLAAAGIDTSARPAGYADKLIELYHERIDHLDHFAPQVRMFYSDDVEYNEDDVAKVLKKDAAQSRAIMEASIEALRESEWTLAALEAALRGVADKLGLGFGKVAQPVRVAVTGTRVSAGLFETIELLGRDTVLARLTHTATTILA